MSAVARGMLNSVIVRDGVSQFLREDIPNFDVGGEVVGTSPAKAQFLVKSRLVIAGFPFVEELFSLLGCVVTWVVSEGNLLEGSSQQRVVVGYATGPANRLLQGERTALEILARCSACATYAHDCVLRLSGTQTQCRVAATRKTTPGFFRCIEKYGAIVGGADPHRYSLSSMVMLKDNHIDIAKSITNAVKKARSLCGFSMKIEVECRSLEDAIEACEAGADVVMLDNFNPAACAIAVPKIKSKFPHVVVEVSGGVRQETIASFAAVKGVDIVSIGLITHGPPSVDISMKVTVDSVEVAKVHSHVLHQKASKL